MTTALAYNDGNKIYIATERQYSGNNFFFYNRKLFKTKFGNYFVFSGSTASANFLRDKIENEENIFDVVNALKEYFKDEENTDDIIIELDGELYFIFYNFTYIKIPVGIIFSCGSGGDYAKGAFTVLKDTMGIKEAMIAAIEVACKLDIYSGGDIDIVEIKID